MHFCCVHSFDQHHKLTASNDARHHGSTWNLRCMYSYRAHAHGHHKLTASNESRHHQRRVNSGGIIIIIIPFVIVIICFFFCLFCLFCLSCLYLIYVLCLVCVRDRSELIAYVRTSGSIVDYVVYVCVWSYVSWITYTMLVVCALKMLFICYLCLLHVLMSMILCVFDFFIY